MKTQTTYFVGGPMDGDIRELPEDQNLFTARDGAMYEYTQRGCRGFMVALSIPSERRELAIQRARTHGALSLWYHLKINEGQDPEIAHDTVVEASRQDKTYGYDPLSISSRYWGREIARQYASDRYMGD